jgi:hypothetical protein
MEVWGVTLLFSPPYCPSYNGACERGHRLLMDVARELQGSSRAALPLEEILPDARIDLNAKPTRRLSGCRFHFGQIIRPPSECST